MDDDQIARLRFGKFHALSQQIERRAQGANHRNCFESCGNHPVTDGDRVVLADYLAEIARRRQMVVQATVGDQEGLATRGLAVKDARDVEAGLTHQVASKFDHQFGRG